MRRRGEMKKMTKQQRRGDGGAFHTRDLDSGGDLWDVKLIEDLCSVHIENVELLIIHTAH